MKIDELKLEYLDKNLSRTIDWLKFAEVKNGTLIAICCGVLFAVYRVVLNLKEINQFLTIYLVIFSLLIIASIIVSLLSFVPRLTAPFWAKMELKHDSDNPLFFGHACKYTKHQYLELFNKSYKSLATDSTTLEVEICDQIVNNSKIAVIKYNMFNHAIWLFISAILTPLGALLIASLKE